MKKITREMAEYEVSVGYLSWLPSTERAKHNPDTDEIIIKD